ncbi:extracellular solute-binding protein [Pseudonocardia alaniniphila]|uniref:Extracellular solute-binding protein n=1 Tax=Pseudonocardia alaniniphila TaxID=75291 RepID=A0ABS9TA11_9PSEU|nr:extracellular solute-binding protein [Pseudonocardia alaniniphila]MCH6165367.1 extracellular solute-binding protein [Pseudonocardia alaniniphila]
MKASGRARRALAALGLAAALVGAAACGTAGPQAGGEGSASAWIISGVTDKAFDDSFDSWNVDHPDQTFAIQSFANDPYKQKIRTAVGAADAPTLIYNWGGGVLRSYVEARAVDDLSDLAADPAMKDRFLPSVAAVGQIDGKTYAVPNNGVKPVMIYYNKDLFAKIGAQPPSTWGELMALVPRFQAAGISPFAVAGQPKWPLLPWFAYLVDRLGGPGVLDGIVANKHDGWSDHAVLEANRMIQDLVNKGGFIKGFASISTDSGADVALLYTGKAAMTLGLPATYQTIKTGDPTFVADRKLGYFPFPAVEGGKGDPADVVGNPSNYWSISAAATPQEKQVARDYIKNNLLNDKYVRDLLTVGNVPPVAGIDDAIATSSDPDYFRTVYDVTAKAPNFQLSLDQALSPAQGDALLTNLQQIFLGQITPEQFSAAMNATVGS